MAPKKQSLRPLAIALALLALYCSGDDGGGGPFSDAGGGKGGAKDGGKGGVGVSDGSWAGAGGKGDAAAIGGGGSGGVGGLGGSGGSGGSGGAAGALCILATHTYGPAVTEIATRYGKLWLWSSEILDTGYPKDLTTIPRYSASLGPCAAKPAGGCGFETVAYSLGGSEIVTAYGKKWSWTNNVLETDFPKDLTSITRYADPGGPCAGASPGTCKFETMAFSPTDGELVVAAGKLWSWTAGSRDPGYPKDLTSISHYSGSGGPCENKTAGNCHFDSMAYDSAGSEVVTGNGKLWRFTAGALDTGYPIAISSVPHFAAGKGGPCL